MADETNVNMSDEYYIVSTDVRQSQDGSLTYAPKKWVSGEVIQTIEMNNIEQGIQIAMEQASRVEDQANVQLARVQNYFDNTVDPAITAVTNRMNGLSAEIAGYVNSNLTDNNDKIVSSFRNLLGSNYVANDATLASALALPSGMSNIDARLVSLAGSLNTTNTNLSNLDTYVRGANNTSSIAAKITTLENELGGGSSGTSFKNRIEGAIGRSIDLESGETKDANTGKYSNSLMTLIENLQSVLGLSGSSAGELSLIEKIEGMIGRTLNLENGETQNTNTGEYSNSIMSAIRELRGVLGMSGGSSSAGSSNLIDKVNAMMVSIYGNIAPNNDDLGDGYNLAALLDELYGQITIDSNTGEISRSATPLINTLKTLPTTVGTLNTRVGAVEAAIDGTNETAGIDSRLHTVEGWSSIIADAYTDAEAFVLQEDEKTYLRLSRNNAANPTTLEQMAADLRNTYIQLPEGGGGGGAATGGGTAIITRVTDTSVQVLTGNICNIQYKLEARDTSNELVGDGTALWYVGGVQVATSIAYNIKSNDANIINTFDISPYLSVGSNNITLQVSVNTGGEYATIVRKTWTVNVINFSFVWNYNEETIFDNGTITLEWIPYGANISKTTYMKIDNEEPIAISNTMQSGITQTYTFEHNLSHGVHTCELYLSATINGQNETTTHQSHDLIIVQPGTVTTIISSSFVSSTMEQYDTIAIPIVVYTPNTTLTNNVILAVDGVTISTWNNVDRTLHYWNYSPSTTGLKVLTISVGNVVKTINITVTGVQIDNAEVSGYDFKLKASEIVSNADLQNNNLLTFSSNFDWVNGGIKSERDTNNNIQQYICVKAGTTMTINKQLFSTSLPNGFNTKIIMKTANCGDYDAKVLDCYSTTNDENIGLELFAHEAVLSSSARRITTQYGEGTYIELEFEVYAENDTPRYMMCWVDGVMSIVRVCDSTDHFNQTDIKNIIIGSTNCDVYIYLIKTYYKKLSINEHIANFIADSPNATTMKARYNRNHILGADNEIDYNLLYEAAPDCRIWLYDIPRMTTGKKDYVKGVGFQQLWKNGGKEYYDGLKATNAVLTVQGTSSVNYRKGAANTDINFNSSDAEGTPTLISASGTNLLDDSLATKGMKLTDSAIPITYANMKVNFASCEQVNNMCNAAWYQNFQPYPSLSPRDCMEFTMGVQFIKDAGLNEPTVEDPTTHTQMLEVPLFSEKENRQANKYYMYSIGNLGNSKKNTAVFHSLNECCVEVTDNTTEGQRMIAWPTTLDWTGKVDNMDHSYEFRYPDDPTQSMKDGWERFVRWMVTWNPNAATDEILDNPETYSAYTFRGHDREGTQVLRGTTVSQYAGTYTHDTFERRMAKMLSECEDYMAMDSVVYHFCYIERHTMVDNVAKNTFWSSAKTIKEVNGVDTEGYWIWDLSKNYDNDTSDGNNNEGQLVFDYGNEANDSIGGKMVFNAADSVWFVFISNLKEACATMFIDRESAISNDGKYTGAWNSLQYHNFLTQEQQKIPELVWNECYRYSYLRTYERGIDTSWISFLDGGQKIHQRRHYETFQELYLASKYMSPKSVNNNITLRGYTPQITQNMTQEQQDIITATLAAVPSKSEVTVTMYNKCYLTVHMGNNFLQQKAQKGVPVTLTFRENGNYLILNDTVINIDTASMIQEIGDLSPLYPGQSSFSAAYRLKSIKIGSNIEGYQNLNISATETGAFDFSTNTMLERLEIQNLKKVEAPLSLTGCPALKYLDAEGSSFTGYSFANGGLLQTAHLGSPNTIIMQNLAYLENNNLIIDDTTKLRYVTIDNCPQIDTFNRAMALNNVLQLNLLNVNWRVQGVDFDAFVTKVKTIPSYLITGRVELTPQMGSFNIGNLGNTFTKDLNFYYLNTDDPNATPQPYYTVTFYGLRGDFLENQYIAGGENARYNDHSSTLFTNDYINAYNIYKNSSWVLGSDTRYGFGSWDIPPSTIITSDLDVTAIEALQYKLTYVMHTEDPLVFDSSNYEYYTEGATINTKISSEIDSFVRNYYKYIGLGWTATDNRLQEPDAAQTLVPSPALKAAYAETWYAVYNKNPNVYKIPIYNTDINGNKQGEPIITLDKKVISNIDSETLINTNELSNYIPGIGTGTLADGTTTAQELAIYTNDTAMYANDLAETNEENRLYRFLDWQPYIPVAGLRVTGDMEILAKYYKVDDVFTNYFLNKLTDCTLSDDITSLPKGAFLHNSNLTKLTTKASHIGKGSFSYFGHNTRQIFIFTNNDVTFDQYCFYGLNNGLIIFEGTGSIYINNKTLSNMTNCTIIIRNSSEPIHTNGGINDSCHNFYNQQNKLYVTSNAYSRYSSHVGEDRIPPNLYESNLGAIITIVDSNIEYQSLLQEAGLL